MSDLPIDDLLTPETAPAHENDPVQAAAGSGWEPGVEDGEEPTTPGAEAK